MEEIDKRNDFSGRIFPAGFLLVSGFYLFILGQIDLGLERSWDYVLVGLYCIAAVIGITGAIRRLLNRRHSTNSNRVDMVIITGGIAFLAGILYQLLL